MEPEEDAFQDLQARDLGMGYDDSSGYITGNDDDSPDSPSVFGGQAGGVPEEIPAQDQPDDAGGGLPGAGDSYVGLGGATGTERFDQDPRDGGIGSPEDEAAIGDADMRTQEAVFQQYTQQHEDETQ